MRAGEKEKREPMDKLTLLRKLDQTLTEWASSHQWGEIWIEIKDGVPTLLKATTQQKLNSHQLGGIPHDRGFKSDNK